MYTTSSYQETFEMGIAQTSYLRNEMCQCLSTISFNSSVI